MSAVPPIIATQELLDEARAAYHKLQMGLSAKVVVDMNGERVEFSAANKANLYNYIVMLNAQLNPATVPGCDGPAGFLF